MKKEEKKKRQQVEKLIGSNFYFIVIVLDKEFMPFLVVKKLTRGVGGNSKGQF